jgi:hypothetical protein
MLRAMFLLFFCLNLVGCSPEKKPIDSQQDFVIIPGVGIKNLSLNDTVQQAKSNFSQDFVARDGYLFLPSRGLDASYSADSRIRTIFLYYKLPNYKPFKGMTETGIGVNSSIEDVYKAYGSPTREGDSVISEFGSVPGAHEHTISYEHLGIEFTFWDKKLADIRVSTPH